MIPFAMLIDVYVDVYVLLIYSIAMEVCPKLLYGAQYSPEEKRASLRLT